jgi:2'-5' RNA ligase
MEAKAADLAVTRFRGERVASEVEPRRSAELRQQAPEWWHATLTLPGLTATTKVDAVSYDDEHALGMDKTPIASAAVGVFPFRGRFDLVRRS